MVRSQADTVEAYLAELDPDDRAVVEEVDEFVGIAERARARTS